MIIQSVSISGFRSFKEERTFEFPNTAGFYLLTGRNFVQPALGANGVGKSSLWDAITWCFFGKTSRGLKASAVANWDGRHQCCVVIRFQAFDVDYKLKRTWNPNALTLLGPDGERTIKQEELEALIEFDYNAFLSVVLMGQFNRFFFDLTPTEKLTVFSEALQLDSWINASEKAKTVVKAADGKIQSSQMAISRLEGAIEANNARLVATQQAEVDFETKRTADLKALEQSMLTARLQESTATKNRDATKLVLTDAQTAFDDQRQALQDLRAEQQTLQTRIGENTREVEILQRDISRITSQRNQTLAAKDKCPTCGGPIDISKNRTQALDFEKQITVIKKQQAEFEVSTQELRLQLTESSSQSATINNSEVATKVKQYTDKLAVAERELTAKRTSRTIAENSLQQLSRQTNPYTAQLKTLAQELDAQAQELEKHNTTLSELQTSTERTRFWVKGFKDLRLWLIEDSLHQLSAEVNNSLIQLGLEGWRVMFDVERENASGGLSKGFTVSILPAEHTEPVPWEGWSGGETQRLRVAGAIGLANLIKSRRGTYCNIEVWDEPTAHLSAEGVADLLTFFDERSKQERLQVWLVDHQALSYGGFTAEIMVEKHVTGACFKIKDRGTWTNNPSKLKRPVLLK